LGAGRAARAPAPTDGDDAIRRAANRSTAPTGAVRHAYETLGRETARLYEIVRHRLGVRVRVADRDPYTGAADLCAELRRHGTMTLCRDEPHPLLGERFDELRVVHDVFGHAALGLGFDLQSEFATWLQCRALFSPAARPAAFSEPAELFQ
jgi:hypothetical protein